MVASGCSLSVEQLPSVSCGPRHRDVATSSGPQARQARTGLRSPASLLPSNPPPISDVCILACARRFPRLPDLLTDPLLRETRGNIASCLQPGARCCYLADVMSGNPGPAVPIAIPDPRSPTRDALRVAPVDTRLSLALRAPFTV